MGLRLLRSIASSLLAAVLAYAFVVIVAIKTAGGCVEIAGFTLAGHCAQPTLRGAVAP